MENERQVVVNDEEVSVKEWLVSLLILLIPVVNIVMMFVWAFGSNVKKSKANFFKAQIVYALIVSVLSFILFSTMGAFIISQLQ